MLMYHDSTCVGHSYNIGTTVNLADQFPIVELQSSTQVEKPCDGLVVFKPSYAGKWMGGGLQDHSDRLRMACICSLFWSV
jgi:hypothetical protein